MNYSAIDIAKQTIYQYNQYDIEINNLKLQQILYFMQGMSYRVFDEELFIEDMEAWKHGCITPNVYNKYAYKGSYPLFVKENLSYRFCDKALSLINDGVKTTLKLDVWYLIDLTHQSGTPWRNCYKNGSKEIVPKEMIKSYFININK